MAAFPLFRQVTFWSVVAGLCPLIPIPFLDDWVLGRVSRRMFRELGAAAGVELPTASVAVLAGAGEGRWPGCLGALGWVLQRGVLKLVQKLFRTVLYFLAVREGIHRATEVFHQGWCFLAAVDALGPEVPWEPAEARAVRAATLATLAQVEVKPIRRAVRRAFWGSFELMLQGSRRLGRLFRLRRGRRAARGEAEVPGEREVLEQEEELLGDTIDRLARALWGNREYFEHLGAVFRRHLATVSTTPPASAS